MKFDNKQWPEVLVGIEFLTKRKDIITSIKRPREDTFSVSIDHPVLGTVIEVYHYVPTHGLLCLKSIFPQDMQEADEFEAVKDYYNIHLLDNTETYIEYFNKEVGYFLLSKNVTQI